MSHVFSHTLYDPSNAFSLRSEFSNGVVSIFVLKAAIINLRSIWKFEKDQVSVNSLIVLPVLVVCVGLNLFFFRGNSI